MAKVRPPAQRDTKRQTNSLSRPRQRLVLKRSFARVPRTQSLIPSRLTFSHACVPYRHDERALPLSSDQGEISQELWGHSKFFHPAVGYSLSAEIQQIKIERTKPAIKGNTNLTHVVAEEEYDNLQWHPLKSVARLP